MKIIMSNIRRNLINSVSGPVLALFVTVALPLHAQDGSAGAKVEVDVKKQRIEGEFTQGDTTTSGQYDAKKGKGEVTYTSGDLSAKVDVDVKKQQVKSEFSQGDVSGTAKVDAKKGTADVHVEAENTQNFAVENDAGNAKGSLTAGAEVDANLKIGKEKVDAKLSAQAGLAAELEAVSKRVGVGDEDVGATAQVSAKVEALIGAKGAIEAHIDKKGITIGVDAKAGAYVSAEAKVDFEAHFFGIKTNVTATAEGHAGAMAEAEAVVSIGFNGKIKFKLSGGLAIGLGGSLGVEFDVDASELMSQLHIDDLGALLEWIDRFRDDPGSVLKEMIGDAAKRLVDAGIEYAKNTVTEVVKNLVDNIIMPTLDWIPDIVQPELPPTHGGEAVNAVTANLPSVQRSTDQMRSLQPAAPSVTSDAGGCVRGYDRVSDYVEWSK